MQIICSPAGLLDWRRPAQGVSEIAGAGFKNISLDISMACPPWGLETLGQASGSTKMLDMIEMPGGLHRALQPFLSRCLEHQLRIPIVRSAFCNTQTKRRDLAPQLLHIHEESIRLCGGVGCQYIVIRPLSAGVPPGEEWEVNRDYYLHLANVAEEYNTTILLENQCRSQNGHLVRGLCSDGLSAVEWVDKLNRQTGRERFGFCLDVGTCSLCGQDMQDFILSLGSRLKAVILRDCDGREEASCLPFTCVYQDQSQTDWLSLVRGLRAVDFDGCLLIKLSDTFSAFPVILRPQLLKLAKEIGRYFKWQLEIERQLRKYHSIVLFGAGNMCRNYMKCYGEQYPPLFACDNDSSLWGSVFCGLEIKPPEALRHLHRDCGVMICNMYYRDIERQVRELGIENIAFFSDEFMPSYYFDRLKREAVYG